jgi:hypothetical protein
MLSADRPRAQTLSAAFFAAALMSAACSGQRHAVAVAVDGGGDPDALPAPGCAPVTFPLAMTGDPIDGDTFDTFAGGFFASYCTGCHASTLAAPAIVGYYWDEPASVRAHLTEIRTSVGYVFDMPMSAPLPTCRERRRLVRWIDAGAP